MRRLVATSSFIVAGLSAAVCASGSQAAEQAPSGSILFSQTHVDAFDSPDGTALYRAPAVGGAVTKLAPLTIGTLDLGARWSPLGHAVVFERVATTDWFTESEIYRMDRNAGELRQITVGKSRHQLPVWGPSNWIAYIDGGVDTNQCVALVRPNGDDQHTLFCPGPTDAVFQAPQWSLDGSELFVEVHYYGVVGVNPPAYSDVYKVDVATGKAARISHLNIGDVAHLSISPDGTHGVYAWDATSAMEVVDFTTGKSLGSEFGDLYGASPSWSRDGRYIAFAQTVNVPGSSYGTFGAVFAMSADGSRVRQITTHPVAFDYYYPVEWSQDDSHILLNRTRYIIQGEHAGAYFSVHVLDVATQAISNVTDNGTADDGAWGQL
ncbi:TolB family protein [Dyella humi]|uniref:WD40 repeat protein n=1 Tax=Dyella humi TaxID=1770547 RepID=A0ABW8IMA5_9GAMM